MLIKGNSVQVDPRSFTQDWLHNVVYSNAYKYGLDQVACMAVGFSFMCSAFD